MKKHDLLKEQKTALFQQLDAVESEQILMLVKAYLDELVAQDMEPENWTPSDQAAIDQGLADLDAGNGIAWEDFRKKFARYAI